jgi:[ribosomal protein S5]-alanine N-acetyltransferase
MKSEPINLRKLNQKDIEILKKFMNNKQILKELCYYKTNYTLKDAKKELTKNQKYKFGIFKKKKLIGKIGLTQENKAKIFEIGYVISPNYRKKGIATWAIKEICKKGFKEFKAVRIHARVLLKNNISQKMLKKCGFKLEGHLKKSFYLNKKYNDELIFGKTK